jgi:hypothetical protein
MRRDLEMTAKAREFNPSDASFVAQLSPEDFQHERRI